MASKEAIQSAVAAYFGATRAMDANAVAEAFAPDGVSNDPVGTPPHKGRDAIRQFMQGVIAVFAYFGCTPMWLVLEVAVLLPSALLELGERERLRPRRGRMLAGAALPGGGRRSARASPD